MGEYVVTGHYTSVEYSENFSKYLLKSDHSIIKDQTYMLYRLPLKIRKINFPLKPYSKQEIREIALKIGLEVHDKKDSQGSVLLKRAIKNFKRNFKRWNSQRKVHW